MAMISRDIGMGILAKNLTCFKFSKDLPFEITVDIGEKAWCFDIDP